MKLRLTLIVVVLLSTLVLPNTIFADGPPTVPDQQASDSDVGIDVDIVQNLALHGIAAGVVGAGVCVSLENWGVSGPSVVYLDSEGDSETANLVIEGDVVIGIGSLSLGFQNVVPTLYGHRRGLETWNYNDAWLYTQWAAGTGMLVLDPNGNLVAAGASTVGNLQEIPFWTNSDANWNGPAVLPSILTDGGTYHLKVSIPVTFDETGSYQVMAGGGVRALAFADILGYTEVYLNGQYVGTLAQIYASAEAEVELDFFLRWIIRVLLMRTGKIAMLNLVIREEVDNGIMVLFENPSSMTPADVMAHPDQASLIAYRNLERPEQADAPEWINRMMWASVSDGPARGLAADNGRVWHHYGMIATNLQGTNVNAELDLATVPTDDVTPLNASNLVYYIPDTVAQMMVDAGATEDFYGPAVYLHARAFTLSMRGAYTPPDDEAVRRAVEYSTFPPTEGIMWEYISAYK